MSDPCCPSTVTFATGPTKKSGEADLRLDIFDNGLELVVDLDDPEASELLARISDSDEDVRMPPPEHGDGLKPEEVDIIRRWIANGAEFSVHWSYQPPVKPAIAPADSDSNWPINAIDRLTLPAMTRRGLVPNPPGNKGNPRPPGRTRSDRTAADVGRSPGFPER